ncbi:protein kinase-PH domain-containing protein, partial [Reticulomyxa filosa]
QNNNNNDNNNNNNNNNMINKNKTLNPVNDTQDMFRLAERTRKTVNNLVDEAFLHLDQENTEKLSRAQFCEWVTRNPEAMELLNSVFDKHLMDGIIPADENTNDDQIQHNDEEKDKDKERDKDGEREWEKNNEDEHGKDNEKEREEKKRENDNPTEFLQGEYAHFSHGIGAGGLSAVSPDITTPASTHASSPDAPSASPGPTYFHNRGDNSPRKKALALQSFIPPGLLPLHEKLMDLHEQEVYEEYYTVYMCGACGFKYSTSTQTGVPQSLGSARTSGGEVHLAEDTSDAAITTQKTERKEPEFCMQCGQELEKHNVKSQHHEQWENNIISRNHAKPSIRKSGPLFKIGRNTGILVERYYVLEDKKLYTFKRHEDRVASDVFFVQGWFIEPFDDNYARAKDKSKQYFGIELQPPHNNADTLPLRKYTRTKEERNEWVKVLRRAASTGSLDDYYKIGEILGRGHFSVYAIKVVEKSKVDASQQMSLRNEIAIMKLVKHPYIINMLDVFEDRKMIYMIMALVEHGDLFKRWSERPGKPKVFSEQVTKIIIWKLLDALQYLHSFGIIHRDLKPENILCTHPVDDTQL